MWKNLFNSNYSEFTDSTCTLKEGQMIFLSPNCSYTIKNPSTEPFIHIIANFAMRSHGCCDQSVFAGIMNGAYSNSRNIWRCIK